MAEKDLYAALGVSRGAGSAEIKRAYRKLARKWHPDLNPGNKEAEERFKEISQAHEILSDPEKRKLYDEFGMASVQGGFDAEQARAWKEQTEAAQRARSGAGASTGGFAGYGTFEDLFGDMFGEGVRGPGPRRGADFENEMEIDLLDALRGLSTTLDISRPEACDVCAGAGADPGSGSPCPTCGGTGHTQVAKGPVSFTRTCRQCSGSGRIGVRPCASCGGTGQKTKRERLHVRIPPGVDTGSRVRIAGKGSPGYGGGPAGDLYIRVRVRPHPLLERRGSDLYVDVPVTVAEAVRGASITVPTADGAVRVQVPPGSQSGRLLRVKGRGVPDPKGKGRGDLYLRLMVRVPEKATDEVSAHASALDAAYEGDVRRNLKL